MGKGGEADSQFCVQLRMRTFFSDIVVVSSATSSTSFCLRAAHSSRSSPSHFFDDASDSDAVVSSSRVYIACRKK